MNLDALRTARLAVPGATHEIALSRSLVRQLAPRIPPAPVRSAQRVWAKLSPSGFSRRALTPSAAARRALLGPANGAPPKFLIRVDEYPYATAFDEPDRYGLEQSARFHSVFADAGVPYLMAVVPQLVHEPFNPRASGGRPLGLDEQRLLKRMAGDGVVFAAHGLTHRTRDARPRRRSELVGLTREQTSRLVDESLALLRAVGVTPSIFVAPFNRFGLLHYKELATRFDVITGGPETTRFLGFQPTPRWLGNAVYCPSYPPLYATATEMISEIERLIEARTGIWVPLTLHLGWELRDSLEGLKQLVERLIPYTVSWADFLRAVDASR